MRKLKIWRDRWGEWNVSILANGESIIGCVYLSHTFQEALARVDQLWQDWCA